MPDLTVDELLTDKQVSELLDVSRTTLWRLRKQAGLPYGKVGRLYRYRKAEILRWVSENPTTTKQLSFRFPDSH